MLTLQGHFTELVSKRSVAGDVSITVSVQKAMSSGGSGTTEVMARP